MIAWLEFIVGVLAILLGLGYLYRPDRIARLNAILRDYLLNDAHMVLERRKWGALFLLMGFLLLYMASEAVLP